VGAELRKSDRDEGCTVVFCRNKKKTIRKIRGCEEGKKESENNEREDSNMP